MAKNGPSSTTSGPLFHYLYSVEFAGKRVTYPDSMKFVLGRSTSSEFVISSCKVSGKHCEIICSKDGWQLHNLSYVSLGTFLNGKVIAHDDIVPLEDEDILKLGNVYIQCRAEMNSMQYKLPSRVLKLQVLIGEEVCSLSSEPEIRISESSYCRPMNRDHKIEDDSIIDLCPEKRLENGEPNKNDSKALERRGKCRILKELDETKAALRQALIAKGEAELELAKVRQEYASANYQQLPNEANKIEELIDQEFQCSICNELLIDATTLDCSHTFCEHCLMEWKMKNKICPLCRQRIKFECRTRTVDSFIERVMGKLPEDLRSRWEEIATSRRATQRPSTECRIPKKRRRTSMARVTPTVRVSVNYPVVLDDTIDISEDITEEQ